MQVHIFISQSCSIYNPLDLKGLQVTLLYRWRDTEVILKLKDVLAMFLDFLQNRSKCQSIDSMCQHHKIDL